jgi:leucyl/phenylalanyl-tRNA--protein transferase
MLTPELLLAGYRQGVFPMAISKRGRLGWFSPDPRAIIPLDDRFHVPHGLRRILQKQKFKVTFDRAFATVIRECARRKDDTWISREIIEGYCRLHRLGYAHSVEVWPAEPAGGVTERRAPRSRAVAKPVGGLYGVHLGGAFFGESMFHRVTDASKVALVALVEHLRARGFVLLDTQWLTPHLAQFGTLEIPRDDYLQRLKEALGRECQF